MKKITTQIVGLLFAISAYCQNGEFKTYPNGLIYSTQTMAKLSHIVDSLNLKFKTCNFDKVFYSKQQAIGHLVKLDTGDIKSAKKDLEQNMSFEDFCLKYPNSKIEKNILILKSKYTTYENKKIVRFEHFDLKSDYGFSIKTEDIILYEMDLKEKWLFDYNKKSEYSNQSLKAFYFPDNFKSIELPKKYSLMIGYSDCLIDTSTAKFKDDLKSGWVELPKNWTSLSDEKKAKLLDEMRSTRVVGGCSMDSRPRTHAVNIALLSAETYKWEVFLKAHLDIMNDRFERMSDGSYAWGQRNTYIKELEVLNINVTDLILGITLRIDNPASNHYYGSIWRVGRALSETNNRNEVENEILSIIADTELDYYNRLLFYFLFKNYNYYIKDEKIKKENNEKLAIALEKLPDYFREQLANK
ncbi:MAG: hypothetical protein Q8K70_01060 [Bacteroidota bacterium]|nr:hypothetical protein [Bacteroidota bacterium]